MADEHTELKKVQEYAALANVPLIESQSDLNPKDKASSAMLAWCREQDDLVVLENGDILTSHPTSRNVQNCKVIMHNKGLSVGIIRPATQLVVHLLLENARTLDEEAKELSAGSVSTQQQRLRVLVRE